MTPTPLWPRLAVVQLLQLPAVALAILAPGLAGGVTAALWGSLVCCAGTDSGWRWWNRLLVVQAVGWISWGLSRV